MNSISGDRWVLTRWKATGRREAQGFRWACATTPMSACEGGVRRCLNRRRRLNFLPESANLELDNDEVGLVQARWSFVNKDENLLTRL
ncbi:hypothetical protein Dimus_033398 [Dionaea muscipula]